MNRFVLLYLTFDKAAGRNVQMRVAASWRRRRHEVGHADQFAHGLLVAYVERDLGGRSGGSAGDRLRAFLAGGR